jgi:histone H3/H4
MNNLTKPSIARLARRAGVKSISDNSFETVREHIQKKMSEATAAALLVNSEQQTKTLMPDDIYKGLQLLGHNVTKSNKLGTSSCLK